MPSPAPFVLRRLAADLPLSADDDPGVRITTVDVADGNLYVGTSAAEILHFVLLPPDPADPDQPPTPIIASRLAPPHSLPENTPNAPGVQQILLLPAIAKAAVLCNNTLSLYSLPELSPDSSFKPISCLWVGGVDLNDSDADPRDGAVVVIGLKKRLRLVLISENSPPRALKAIEYGGCLVSVRRDAFSCAADAHSYALLDVMHQQKIGLFPISSLDPDVSDIGGAAESLATVPSVPSRSVSSASAQPQIHEHPSHSRSTSLNFLGSGPPSRTESPRPTPRYGFDVPESLSRAMSPALSPTPSPGAPAHVSSESARGSPSPDKPSPQEAHPPFIPLKPHIASPNPNEFLLTVGTTPSEPGVGMFVNLDGDMCRGSVQFSSYPDAILVDGSGLEMDGSMGPDMDAEEGYVLAAVHREGSDNLEYGVEIQRWDVEPSGDAEKDWLDLTPLGLPSNGGTHVSMPLGMRAVAQPFPLVLSDIGARLTEQRLRLPGMSDHPPVQKQADDFIERLSKLQSRSVVWAGDQIWWTVRNPLVTRLDARIEQAQFTADGALRPNRDAVESLLGDIRGQEARGESEYVSLIYIRQKASVLLFMDVILRTKSNISISDKERNITEQALIEGEVDPRIVLSLLPILNKEVVQGPEGIQVFGGTTTLIEQFLQQNDPADMPTDVDGPFGNNLLHFVKRYLQFWRRRKGMASVTSDPNVYRAVDAALLHILLLLDRSGTPGMFRNELNELVDNQIECFDRAVELLGQFKRLYVLSRLYQSNCKASVKAAKVLATWRLILEGEEDQGGAFTDGENEVRKYLARIRDQSLVEEYGAWLANRNPKLGVQIFADDHSRVKFEPTHAVALLKEKAPAAVKEYLEYLVFGKKHTQYVNELISFYLETVVTELESNPSSREILSQTYSTYRILSPPKPTYHAFITDNALPAPWWDARLRLLQLLSTTPTTPDILTRLQPHSSHLIPEMIILHGHQHEHQAALRLLTHGLGDFDTAISYCMYGPGSIFAPAPRAGKPPVPHHKLPSRDLQSEMLAHLLAEFLDIEDMSVRISRTAELLERFGAWLDVSTVLGLLPDEWSVDIVSGYLVGSLRRLVRERQESGVVRALVDAENSRVGWGVVEKRGERVVEGVDEGDGGEGDPEGDAGLGVIDGIL